MVFLGNTCINNLQKGANDDDDDGGDDDDDDNNNNNDNIFSSLEENNLTSAVPTLNSTRIK
jgi:hypothetical protein